MEVMLSNCGTIYVVYLDHFAWTVQLVIHLAVNLLTHEVFFNEHRRRIHRIDVSLKVEPLPLGRGNLLLGRPKICAGFDVYRCMPSGISFRRKVMQRIVVDGRGDIPTDTSTPTVKLIGAHEVHFTRADRVIPIMAPVPGDSQHIAGQRRIEAGAAAMPGAQAGQEALPARYAHRRGRICRSKVGAFRHASVECRHPDMGIPLDRHQIGAMLVVNQEQNVGSVRHI